MSEPCRHEREFAGTQADTLTSFVRTSGALVKMTAERDAALAALARVQAFMDDWSDCGPDSQCSCCGGYTLIRAALEPTP